MRIKEIVDYVVMKCHECEDMTKSMFFATVMNFVRQVMVDLEYLQEEIACRPASRPTDVPRAPGVALEALMYSWPFWLWVYILFFWVCSSFSSLFVFLFWVCMFNRQYFQVFVIENPKRFYLMKYWKKPKILSFLLFHICFLNYVMIWFMRRHDT